MERLNTDIASRHTAHKMRTNGTLMPILYPMFEFSTCTVILSIVIQAENLGGKTHQDPSDIHHRQRMVQFLRLTVSELSILSTPGASIQEQAIHIDSFLRGIPDLVYFFIWMQNLCCHHHIIQCPFLSCVPPIHLLLHSCQETLQKQEESK